MSNSKVAQVMVYNMARSGDSSSTTITLSLHLPTGKVTVILTEMKKLLYVFSFTGSNYFKSFVHDFSSVFI